MSSLPVYGPSPSPASYGVAAEAPKEEKTSSGISKTMLVAGIIFSAIAVTSFIGIAFVANPLLAIGLFGISLTAAMVALPLILVAVMPSSTSSYGYVSDTHHTDVVVVGPPPVHSSRSVLIVDGRRSPPPAYVSPYAARPSHPVSSRLPHSDGVRMANPIRESSVPSRGHGGYAAVNSRR